MKRKLTTLLLLMIFLVSLFPVTMAQDENIASGSLDTATVDLTTQDESELENVDDTNCWSDKPDYKPGVDKGFFIWQGTCGQFWWIDWSGDTKEKWRRWYRIVHGTEPATDEPTTEEVIALENAAATLDTSTLTTEEVTELQASGDIVNTATATGAQIVARLKNKISNTGESNTAGDNTAEGNIAGDNTIRNRLLKIKRPKLMYRVKGTITSNGQIFDVGVRKFDRRDKIVFRPGKNVITFHGWVGPYFDGVFFKTIGDKVTFDLEFDGQKSTEVIYVGKDKSNPDSNPFTLNGEPATKRVCPVGSIIYNKRCVSQVAGIAVTPNGLAGDLADKEVPTESLVIKPSEPRPTVLPSAARSALAKLTDQARLRWQAVNERRSNTVTKLQELKATPAFAKFKEELNFRARVVNEVNLKQLKEDYKWIKENLVKANERSQLAHTNFLDAKKQLATCTDNCEELEERIIADAKEFLLRTADAIISHLEKVKNRVESSEDLTEEEASEVLTKIVAEIQRIEDAKAKVEAATTKEEVRKASKTILDSWKRIKNYTLLFVGKLINARHGGIVVKIKHLELRLQKVLEKMEESGKDTSGIQPLLDEFHSQLLNAEENFQLAKEAYRNGKIEEARGYMGITRKALEDAHKTFKDIVRAIKAANGADELSGTTVEEAEQIGEFEG